MADLLIRRTIKIGEVYTDADTAPVLRDPDAAFGMRRIDTQEIILPAGWELTRISDGIYERTVTGLIPGVAYEYHIETTINGAVNRAEKSYTPPFASVLPTYNTLEEAKAIAVGLHGAAAWAAASDAEKLAALQTASMRVDASRRWQGRKYNLDADGKTIEQDKEFPRIDGRYRIDVNPDDVTSLIPVVPRAIKIAEVLEANSLLDGSRAERIAAQHDGLAMQTVSSLSEQYRAPANSQGIPILCAEADMLCRRYQLKSGRLL